MGMCRRAVAAGAVIGLAACSTPAIDTAPTADAEQLYASLYPYYAELCAVSELKKRPGFGAEISSGSGGHAILYLNGVCRVDGEHYPVIGLCDPSVPADRRGVGLSVNAHYKNAAWVATPGRDFLFHGRLAPGERLTHAAYERTQREAKARGILDGIEFHDVVFDDRPPSMSRPDYMYDVSVATDYAIGFGRDRYCARVPMTREKMMRVVAYLNGLNAPYRSGEKEFEWDVLRDNCAHIAHNALAQAGVWGPWPTDRFILIAAFDFPVPKNEFVNLMRRTNDFPIDDIDEVYDDDAARQALMRSDSLPTGPGALAEAEPAVRDNDVYDTDLRLIFYDDPIVGPYQRRFDRIFSEPRYLDLRANLQYFAGLYREIEGRRQPLAAFLSAHDAEDDTPERDALAQFYAQYYRHVADASAATSAALASLPPARAARVGGPPEPRR